MTDSDARRHDASARLQHLLADEWEQRMRDNPLFATHCGDHRFNDRLPVVSEAESERRLAQIQGFLGRLQAIARDALSPADQLDYDLFERELKDRIARYTFHTHLMPIDKTTGFHVAFAEQPNVVPLRTVEEYESYVARLAGFRAYTQGHIELMRAGMRAGFVPARVALEGAEGSIEPHIVADPTQSVYYKPFVRFPPGIDEQAQRRLSEAGRAAIADSIVPGYQALLRFVREEYAPAARPEIAASALPDGRAYYEHCVRMYTTLELTPEEVHDTGLSEVRRIREEMEATISKAGFRGAFHEFLHYLRSEPRFYADTPQALLQHAALIAKRMDGELPGLFSVLPRTPYGIRPIPDYIAPKTTTAYYFLPSGDGTKAGFYYVNTYDLASRPLYEYEALTLHEAVPGHHLQLALQMELGGVPNYRRFGGVTAFIEGWALYAERLGLEVGFYQDPYSDFGRLTFEMWRACRLVVDTGMHCLGWTRQQAIDFMAENTALSLLNITNEIDRYIARPGQALAYKIGEIKIRELRTLAERELGSKFDIREFHRILHEDGGIPLNVLEAKVRRWVAGQVL